MENSHLTCLCIGICIGFLIHMAWVKSLFRTDAQNKEYEKKHDPAYWWLRGEKPPTDSYHDDEEDEKR